MESMKQGILVFGIVSVLFSGFAWAQATGLSSSEALSIDEVMIGVQSFYDNVESYHADFRQISRNIALDRDQIETGHVYFLKPGKMRWDYLSPSPKYLISDGQQLWYYEPNYNQYAQFDLTNSELPVALRFLMGEGNLMEDFSAVFSACERAEAYCLSMTPIRASAQYHILEFVVNSATFQVEETTIFDALGNQNRFEFSNVSTTDDLPIDGFTFTPQPDMRQVIR
jgi:outer membrane lipoprotein carrier protein